MLCMRESRKMIHGHGKRLLQWTKRLIDKVARNIECQKVYRETIRLKAEGVKTPQVCRQAKRVALTSFRTNRKPLEHLKRRSHIDKYNSKTNWTECTVNLNNYKKILLWLSLFWVWNYPSIRTVSYIHIHVYIYTTCWRSRLSCVQVSYFILQVHHPEQKGLHIPQGSSRFMLY